jgi:hypothetical protein
MGLKLRGMGSEAEVDILVNGIDLAIKSRYFLSCVSSFLFSLSCKSRKYESPIILYQSFICIYFISLYPPPSSFSPLHPLTPISNNTIP